MGFTIYLDRGAPTRGLIHEDTPRWGLVFKMLAGIIWGIALFSGICVIAYPLLGGENQINAEKGMVFLVPFAIFLPVSLLVHALMPRRYQIFADRVRIVLGWPFAYHVPMNTIERARPGTRFDAYFSWGFRFVCASEGIVCLDRGLNGGDIVVSPGNREKFLERIETALSARAPSGKK